MSYDPEDDSKIARTLKANSAVQMIVVTNNSARRSCL